MHSRHYRWTIPSCRSNGATKALPRSSIQQTTCSFGGTPHCQSFLFVAGLAVADLQLTIRPSLLGTTLSCRELITSTMRLQIAVQLGPVAARGFKMGSPNRHSVPGRAMCWTI
jgi:hypothetical protein